MGPLSAGQKTVVKRRRTAAIAVVAAAVAVVVYLIARPRTVALGPPPRMVEGPAASPAAAGDEGILQPARELVFERDAAPGNVVFSEKLGLAYVTCLGEMGAPDDVEERKLPSPELCVVETRTGRVVERTPVPGLVGADLSPNQRYLQLFRADWETSEGRGVSALYAIRDLSRALIVDKGAIAALAATGCDGRVFLGYSRERKIRRVSATGEQSTSLDRVPLAMCLDPSCSHLYVSVLGSVSPGADNDEVPPPSIVVLDPSTLEVLQTATLRGRWTAYRLALWAGGSSLVVTTEGDTLDIIPVGPDGLLDVPEKLSGIHVEDVAMEPVIDEKRSLAYCLNTHGIISVVDLAGRRLIGSFPLAPREEDWNQPDLSLSTTTDELWVAPRLVDRIPIYRIEDVVKRARESAATSTTPIR
jgi:hypothetical protein